MRFTVKRSKYHPNPDNRAMDIVIASLCEENLYSQHRNVVLMCQFFFVTIYGYFECSLVYPV